MGVTRRGLLLGGSGAAAAVVAGGAGLLEAGLLPGSGTIKRHLGWDGPSGHVPDVAIGRVTTGTRRGVPWALTLPPGSQAADGLPVVVTLGGRGQGLGYQLHHLGLPQFLAAGHHRMALLSVAGADTYYHRRRSGPDVAAVVASELLPMVGAQGADVSRPAYLGWSMGGYGALLLASDRLVAGRPVGAVAATSAAVWPTYAASAPGAFDDEADFRAHDLTGRARQLRRVPVRLDCGEEDPFYGNDQRLAGQVGAQAHYASGAHNGAFWTRVLPAQLRWLQDRLDA